MSFTEGAFNSSTITDLKFKKSFFGGHTNNTPINVRDKYLIIGTSVSSLLVSIIAIIIALVRWRKRKDNGATKFSVDINPMYNDKSHYYYEEKENGEVEYSDSDENYYDDRNSMKKVARHMSIDKLV